MEIQWVILAQDYLLSKKRNLSIVGIIDQFTIHGDKNKASMYLIAKVIFNPKEAWENKVITLRVDHDKYGELKSFDKPYKVPDLNTLVNRITYWVTSLSNIEFVYAGKYTFTILIDGAYKNEESIDVTYTKEEGNA
jgi:hypothetical protein